MAYTSEDFSSSQNFQEEQTLTLKHPVEHGIVVDWDDMAKTWHHAVYNERRAAPDECPALQAEAPLDCKSTCERMTQLKREMLVASAMHAAIQAVLFLDVLRDIMGIVMDSGGGFANFAEGYVLLYVIPCVDLAGRDVVDDFMRNLTEPCCVIATAAGEKPLIFERRLAMVIVQSVSLDEGNALLYVNLHLHPTFGLGRSSYRRPHADPHGTMLSAAIAAGELLGDSKEKIVRQ